MPPGPYNPGYYAVDSDCNPSASDLQLCEEAAALLREFGINDELPIGWNTFGGITISDGGGAFDLVIASWWNTWCDYATVPQPDVHIEYWDLAEAGVIFRTVPVLVAAGVGMLTDHLLEDVIEKAIDRVNKWTRPRFFNGFRLLRSSVQQALTGNCDTPFATAPISTWKYHGDKYDKSAVNYILEGHAMHHLKIPYVDGLVAVYTHNWVNNNHSVATSGEVYWYSKGFWGYWWRN
jgi:hypothetical protein